MRVKTIINMWIAIHRPVFSVTRGYRDILKILNPHFKFSDGIVISSDEYHDTPVFPIEL